VALQLALARDIDQRPLRTDGVLPESITLLDPHTAQHRYRFTANLSGAGVERQGGQHPVPTDEQEVTGGDVLRTDTDEQVGKLH